MAYGLFGPNFPKVFPGGTPGPHVLMWLHQRRIPSDAPGRVHSFGNDMSDLSLPSLYRAPCENACTKQLRLYIP